MVLQVLWGKDEKSFICAGLGQYITRYSLIGEELEHWKVANVVDIAFNKTANILVGICQQQKINIIDLNKNTIER